MKSKKTSKKLNLNKQTIAVIGKEEMGDVKAGDMPIFDFTPFQSLLLARCPGALEKKPSNLYTCPE